MMTRISILMLVVFFCFVSTAWPQAYEQKKPAITTFDVPGAGTGAGQGTIAWGVVQGGWIQGDYIDSNGVYHGFLRRPNGAITKFDVSGMGTGAGQGAVEVSGMNQDLEIAGWYFDSDYAYHSFIRWPQGKFKTFGCPSAAAGGTAAVAVSSKGLVSLGYQDSNQAWHGCLREPDGTFIEYDPPNSGTGAGQGVYAGMFGSASPEGAVVGSYADDNWMWHSYLRAPDGTITEFNDPNVGPNGGGTLGISAKGEIWGWYIDANNAFHGYLRSPDGTFTEVDAPGAGTGAYQGTTSCWSNICAGGISPDGKVAGWYADSNNVFHGFVRTSRGEFKTFDAPGAGTGAWQGTLPVAINPEGAITGYYTDANGVYHGFLRLADRQWDWNR